MAIVPGGGHESEIQIHEGAGCRGLTPASDTKRIAGPRRTSGRYDSTGLRGSGLRLVARRRSTGLTLAVHRRRAGPELCLGRLLCRNPQAANQRGSRSHKRERRNWGRQQSQALRHCYQSSQDGFDAGNGCSHPCRHLHEPPMGPKHSGNPRCTNLDWRCTGRGQGGSYDVEIRANHMTTVGWSAVDIGGDSWPLRYFRPPVSEAGGNVEARDSRVIANVIEHSDSPFVFVSATDSLAANNTMPARTGTGSHCHPPWGEGASRNKGGLP